MQARNLLQCSQIHVQPVAVVVVAEVVEPRLGGGLGVQDVGVERAVGRHRRHHVENLLRLLAEAWLR